MRSEREQKIRSVIRQSQPDLTVILENINDPLNISAVLRSCDAVGIREVFVVYTQKYLEHRGLRMGKKTSAGTFRWMDVYVFDELEECFQRARQRYGRILATSPGEQAVSLYEMDFTQPTALLFGNEDEGVSAEALEMADGNFHIPQAGFAESLNISVACAVSLFEARRQRAEKGFYDDNPQLTTEQQEQLFQRWSSMLKNPSWHRQTAISVGKASPPILPVYVERVEQAPKKQIRYNPLTKFDL